MQGCPLSQPYQNTDATGQAGMQIDRQTDTLLMGRAISRMYKNKENKRTQVNDDKSFEDRLNESETPL